MTPFIGHRIGLGLTEDFKKNVLKTYSYLWDVVVQEDPDGHHGGRPRRHRGVHEYHVVVLYCRDSSKPYNSC